MKNLTDPKYIKKVFKRRNRRLKAVDFSRSSREYSSKKSRTLEGKADNPLRQKLQAHKLKKQTTTNTLTAALLEMPLMCTGSCLLN